ncbi:esterase-like activity of phytase family protein [Novosphingobium resinovorum]|uniref:esterase-like activity of phytase family protein n=1 Tax=Novosphingobium resinovorum TaxID=158500 RepID=UPI002ED6695B|nr:esterase-like activity of phytase family protein [Novosphingobium resinovorum]
MRSPRVEHRGKLPLIDAVIALPLPDRRELAGYLGPFRLEGMWQVKSRHPMVFGYSALVAEPDGRLLAFNDSGDTLSFAPPGVAGTKPRANWIRFERKAANKSARDVESATRDPATGGYWVGLEGRNSIVRLSPKLAATGEVAPTGMRGWGVNTGPEALSRLPDGRFVTIREIPPTLIEPRLHDAVLFAGDPIEHPHGQPFRFDGPDNFSVVDMTLLPDGRALILMRRLLWPFPLRFAGRIVIADTRRIRPGRTWHSVPLASLASVLPVDNFEAIAAVPQPDGRITIWVMSDDNMMRVLQRTLLWKLTVDPKRLPWPE